MKMTLEDRSLYFKGLLLLIRMDHVVTPEEKDMLLKLGKLLEFNAAFCETTINNLLENKHITDHPPKFSNKECARVFIKDCFKVAFADKNLHLAEYEWIQKIAAQNEIATEWVTKEMQAYLATDDAEIKESFEIEKYYGKLLISAPALKSAPQESRLALPLYGKKDKSTLAFSAPY